MERPTCATCAFWDKASGEWCRRNPPVAQVYLWPNADEPSNTSAWPGTWEGDWCGEHDQFPRYLATLDEGRHSPETMP
jgi:hypothetical protein